MISMMIAAVGCRSEVPRETSDAETTAASTEQTTTAETTAAETTTVLTPPEPEARTVFTPDAHMVLFVTENNKTQAWNLTKADGEAFCELLNRSTWENCVIGIDPEYDFTINGIELEYSPTHSMIFDRKNQRRIRLSTQDRLQMDEILDGYGAQNMTMSDVKDLLIYGERLRWSNLVKYKSSDDIGSGLYILRYAINSNFYLLVGGGSPLEDAPLSYARLVWREDESLWVDIRKMRSISELLSHFTFEVLPEDKVVFMPGWDSPSSCLTDEDAAILCEIVNRGEWVDAEGPDDAYAYYFDFVFLNTFYYPQHKMLWDFENGRVLFLSDEDVKCIDEMMSAYVSQRMTLDDVCAFAEKGSATWADLAFFDGRSTGSGMTGAIYTVDENYTVTVWASHNGRSTESVRMYLYSAKDDLRIKVFDVDMDKFLSGDFSVSYDIDYGVTGAASFSRKEGDKTYNFAFLEGDAERLCDILNSTEWFVGSKTSSGNFVYQFDFGDCNFSYDADTGILCDRINLRMTTLPEAEKAIVDEILSVYGVRTMTLDDVRALVKKPELTWTDLIPFKGAGTRTVIYVIDERFYVEIKGKLGEEIESAYLYYGEVYNWKDRANLLMGSSVDWLIQAYGPKK